MNMLSKDTEYNLLNYGNRDEIILCIWIMM